MDGVRRARHLPLKLHFYDSGNLLPCVDRTCTPRIGVFFSLGLLFVCLSSSCGSTGEGEESVGKSELRSTEALGDDVPEHSVGISLTEYLTVVQERVDTDLRKLEHEVGMRDHEFARVSKKTKRWRALLLRLQLEALAAFPASALSSEAKTLLSSLSKEKIHTFEMNKLDRTSLRVVDHLYETRVSGLAKSPPKSFQQLDTQQLQGARFSQNDRGLLLIHNDKKTETLKGWLSKTFGPIVVEHCVAQGSTKGAAAKLQDVEDYLKKSGRNYRIFKFAHPGISSDLPCGVSINLVMYNRNALR